MSDVKNSTGIHYANNGLLLYGVGGKAKQPPQSFHVFGELRFILRFSAWCGLCYYYQPEDCVSQFSYYHHMVGVYVPTYYLIVLRDSHIAGKKFWKISLSKILQVRLFVLTSDICCESEL